MWWCDADKCGVEKYMECGAMWYVSNVKCWVQ